MCHSTISEFCLKSMKECNIVEVLLMFTIFGNFFMLLFCLKPHLEYIVTHWQLLAVID